MTFPLTRSRSRARFFGVPFTPASLFANGEQGAWYDPSDYGTSGTLFTDAAGTTPVTAVEQAVRLMLDKSGRGNHATAPNDSSRPILRARYNLLTYSEDFSNADWNAFNVNVTTNAIVAPDGTTTADFCVPNTTLQVHRFVRNISSTTTTNTLSFYAKAGGYNIIEVYFLAGVAASLRINVSNGNLSSAGYGNDLSSLSTAVAVGGGWYRITMPNGGNGNTSFWIGINGMASFTGDGTSGIYIWGAQLLTAADVTATGNVYQRVAAATSYDTSNSVWRPYLAASLSAMQTASINPGSVDKAQMFAGVTKLNESSGIIAENGAIVNSTDGTFAVLNAGSQKYLVALRGTSLAYYEPATYAAPVTNVVTGLFDIGEASISGEIVPRINGVVEQDGPVSVAGTGNFTTQPLNILARNNGASNPFTGRLYSMIVRFGANLSAGEISSTEAWVNGKTGAY